MLPSSTLGDCGTSQGITKGVIYKGEKVEVSLVQSIRGRVSRVNIVDPISDEVVRRDFGVVCDPFNEAGLATTIAELLQYDRRVRQMSLRGFAEARAMAPTSEQWCDELVALYHSRIGDGSAMRPIRASRSPRPLFAVPTAASLTGAAG